MAENTVETNHLELATELTIAWLSNPNTRASAEEVPSFLETMHGAVTNLSNAAAKAGAEVEAAQPEYTPAVSARKSLSSKDHIISLIDGKPYKTLRRHLARHGLTPEQYRERYGLKPDYPMVAENYAEVRRNLAKKIGLGRKPRNTDAAAKAGSDAAIKAPAKPAGEAAAKPASAPAAKDVKTATPAKQPRRKAREAAPKDADKAAAPKATAPANVPAKSPAPKAAKPAAKKPAAAKGAPKTGAAAAPKSDASAGGTSTPNA